MLQRIQSIFLALAVVLNLGALFVPLWKYSEGDMTEYISGMGIRALAGANEGISTLSFTDNIPHILFFAVCVAISAFIALVIFQYKDRLQQVRLCYFAIVGLFIEILTLVFLTFKGPYLIDGPDGGGQVQYGFALPVLAVIMIWLAFRRIKADEALVRSVDRIR